MENKREKGQFYTKLSSYILQGFSLPENVNKIIEPFAGQGDLIDWIKKQNNKFIIDAYDIEPKQNNIIKKDTLENPPDYKDSWIVTNPPYLARNKTKNKTIFEKYKTNDLYKCFITSICEKNICEGGIIIIPVGFFLSPRKSDTICRTKFLNNYKIEKVNYFEERVFEDTSTTIVSILFTKNINKQKEQTIKWFRFPQKDTREFIIKENCNWIIGGEIYNTKIDINIKIYRLLEKDDDDVTNLTLNALDSGRNDKRISLMYNEKQKYKGKHTSRSYATLCIKGKKINEEQQKEISKIFNDFIEKKREKTWSLFLPQYRESKEYARKRMPFELAYNLVNNIITNL